MNAEELISRSYWEEHRDFDDYSDLLLTHLKSVISKFNVLDTKGHRASVVSDFNAFKDGTLEDYRNNNFIYALHGRVFYYLDLMCPNDLSMQYDVFMEYLNNGFSVVDDRIGRLINFARSDCNSYDTGQLLKIIFNVPYTPELIQYSFETKWIPATPYIRPGVQHMIFDCPSGELIAADWIRIEKFSERAQKLPETEKNNISYIEGRINNSIQSNEMLNLFEISLGNMTVDIFQNNNVLVVGDGNDYTTDTDDVIELDGFKEAGRICTDRWSFTCIDRVHLEKILAEEGVSDPKAMVDNYLAKKHYRVNTLKVTPGQYHVYFSGDHHEFNKEFKSPDFPLKDKFTYYAIISDKELKLENGLDNTRDMNM